MKYLISILVIFAAAVALGRLLQNSAYVMLVYPPYRIALSLKLFFVLFLAVLILAHWLLQLLSATRQLPTVVQKFRLDRAKNRERKLQDVALRAFFEGRYVDAEKAAKRAIKQGNESIIYSLIAARAAHELDEFERSDAYLAKAEHKFQGDATMRLLIDTKSKFASHR
ncbi:MAG: heme biosynthesis HemY N-terminal domain-containing protein [Gallionella sp.]